MKNYEIKQAFKNLPDAGLPDNEPVMCCEYGSAMSVIIRRMVLFAGTATANV